MAKSNLPNNKTKKQLVPPVKYPGGKRFLVPKILPFWLNSDCQRLVEPFSGGLSVAIGVSPKKALLNDKNPHIINFYLWVQKGMKIDIPMHNDESLYYEYRERFNKLVSSGKPSTKISASLFYYLNKTGYNGLVRFNKSGLWNVPFGTHKTITYKRVFPEIEEVIKSWVFKSNDFSKLKIKNTDLLYLDPPYDVEFRSYSQGGFHWDDQTRLLEWLESYKNPIIISNQATDRIVKLYKSFGFKLDYINVPRMISCNGNRKRAVEVFATKNI